jgi:hypothetical protein
MKLKLMPLANGALTEVSLSGAVSTTVSLNCRRQLLKTLAEAGELEVALCVGADGLHDWCDAWTRAVEGVSLVSVTFELSGPPSAGDRRDA